MENIKYVFHWSTLSIVITAIFIVAVALVLIFTYPYHSWWMICINLFLVLLSLYFIAICPRYWETSNEGIKLVRVLAPNKFYSFDDYTIDVGDKSEAQKFLRLFATGGFMGFTGLFYSQELGRFPMYLTDEKGDLLILTNRESGKKVVLGGTLPEAFLNR